MKRMLYYNKIIGIICILVIALLGLAYFLVPQAPVSSSSGIWVWPLEGGIILEEGKYRTVLENTDYGVRNPDLVHTDATDRMGCFEVGSHRLYHAGVDLYYPNGNTANAVVKAVSNGTVLDTILKQDGWVIVIEHDNGIYSAYWHLLDKTAVCQELCRFSGWLSALAGTEMLRSFTLRVTV